MCGRFTLFEPDKVLAKEFGVSDFPPRSPRYNIAPPAHRGCTCRPRGKRTRACTSPLGPHTLLVERSGDRQPPHQRSGRNRQPKAVLPQCVQAASLPDPRQRVLRVAAMGAWKQPYFVRMRDGHPFAFAGYGTGGKPRRGRCRDVRDLDNRRERRPGPDPRPDAGDPSSYEYARWLDPSLKDTDSLAPLLVPFPPEGMVAFPVNPRVNTPSVDDEKCIALFRRHPNFPGPILTCYP